MKLVKGHYPKGISEILINKSELPSNGVYYYQLESNGNTAQKKDDCISSNIQSKY